jgi:carbon-monoxide dehydrogenase medium subunit
MKSFEFIEATDIKGALNCLDVDDSQIRTQAGGTALMLMMKSGVYQPSKLVSLRGISNLDHINVGHSGELLIGSMTTLSALEHSELVKTHAPVISLTMKRLANVRVRNIARIGGALAHGDPHMDLPPLLSALGASVTAVSKKGSRTIDVIDLYKGYYETALRGDEIIEEICIPNLNGSRCVYLKCTTRSAEDWPALGVAVKFQVVDQCLQDVQIVLGSIGEVPIRMGEVQDLLEGKPARVENFELACELAHSLVEPVGDALGSAEYKKELVKVYLKRALEQALNNEGGI